MLKGILVAVSWLTFAALAPADAAQDGRKFKMLVAPLVTGTPKASPRQLGVYRSVAGGSTWYLRHAPRLWKR